MHCVLFALEQLLSTLSDLVCWVLQGCWHQRMGVAILISSSLSPVCARGQILNGPVTQRSLLLCSSAGTMRSFSACLFPPSLSVYTLLCAPGEHNGLRRSAFEVLCSYLCASLSISPSLCFITFLKLNVLISPWCCHLISAKINFHVSGYLLLLPLYFSFKKRPVVLNQWVINYWGCAGWQDACPVLFARWIIRRQDAGHVRMQHIRRFLSPPTAWGGSTNQQLRTKPLYF